MACVVGYLTLPLFMPPAVPGLARQLASAFALAVPFAFWLSARLYFDDAFQARAIDAFVLLGLLAVRASVLRWPLAASTIAMVVVVDALRRIHAGSHSDL